MDGASVKNLEPEVVETLMEIGNVGMGKATAVLGKMLETRISVDISNVLPASAMALSTAFSSNEEMIGVLLGFTNDLLGATLFVVKKDFAKKLLRQIVTDEEYNDNLFIINEDSVSAIQEVANIMMSSYLSAISKYTDFKIWLEAGMVCIDPIKDMLLYPITRLENYDENKNICVESTFSVCNDDMKIDESAQGHIFFFPESDSLKKLINELNSI
ncbi:MAG: chemotaxis protein CheC [Clostridiales bacterium]|nr:chemotaxis protein CheC [Clostridiales bacterium]